MSVNTTVSPHYCHGLLDMLNLAEGYQVVISYMCLLSTSGTDSGMSSGRKQETSLHLYSPLICYTAHRLYVQSQTCSVCKFCLLNWEKQLGKQIGCTIAGNNVYMKGLALTNIEHCSKSSRSNWGVVLHCVRTSCSVSFGSSFAPARRAPVFSKSSHHVT